MMDKTAAEMFEKAPAARAVLKNTVPAMAAMLMVLVYNLADTFFIGQTRSDILVAAVSLATPVFLIFMAVGTVFGAGGTSVISRAFGQGRGEYARKVCSFCMWSCVVVGVLLSAGFLLFMDQILRLVGASADTWEPARTYLAIVAFSGPFVLISNCFSNILRAEGQSGRAMMGQLLGNLLNIVLDPIMILTFDWDIAGAAVATVIGNVVGAGCYLLYFLRGKSSLSIRIRDCSLKDGICTGVLSIGIPASLLTDAYGENKWLESARSQIFRLFTILLDNAVKYCDPGGTIHFSLTIRGRNLCVSASNPCQGLDPALLPRYFDRFYRADSSRARETGGYGIGLSTAKAIVTRHRGHISNRYANGIITFSATIPQAN